MIYMAKTYYLLFRVVPAEDNVHHGMIKGALAHFWVVDTLPASALFRAENYLAKYKWRITELVQDAVETTAEHSLEKEIGIKHYIEAQVHGISAAFASWVS